MDAREEFEKIKNRYKELKKQKDFHLLPEGSKMFVDDMSTLINIIDVLNKKSKQDNATIKHYLNSQYGKKVQLSSLYGEHKEIYKNVKICIDTSNDYFKEENADVEITDKFVIIRKEEQQRFYNINEIEYFSICESEVE